MPMTEHDYNEIADRITERIECHTTLCPLGLTERNARTVSRTLSFARWAGLVFAGSIIVSFASGFIYVLYEAARVVVRTLNTPL